MLSEHLNHCITTGDLLIGALIMIVWSIANAAIAIYFNAKKRMRAENDSE